MTTLPPAAVRSHILHYLYRYKNQSPVTVGDLKRIILGSGSSYDEIMDDLWKGGYVSLQEDQRSLSDEGLFYMEQRIQEEKKIINGLVFEDRFDLALLGLLAYRGELVNLEDFPQFLIDHAPKRPGRVGFGGLIDALHDLEQQAYAKAEFNNWYKITEPGKDFYEYQASKFKHSIGDTETSGNLDAEVREMNKTLNSVLEKLEVVLMGNEVIWTDMKADFEELRNLTGLGKKNWRQLMIGKLTEWTAGGIVTETISKKIVEFIKPGVKSLLE